MKPDGSYAGRSIGHVTTHTHAHTRARTHIPNWEHAASSTLWHTFGGWRRRVWMPAADLFSTRCAYPRVCAQVQRLTHNDSSATATTPPVTWTKSARCGDGKKLIIMQEYTHTITHLSRTELSWTNSGCKHGDSVSHISSEDAIYMRHRQWASLAVVWANSSCVLCEGVYEPISCILWHCIIIGRRGSCFDDVVMRIIGMIRSKHNCITNIDSHNNIA